MILCKFYRLHQLEQNNAQNHSQELVQVTAVNTFPEINIKVVLHSFFICAKSEASINRYLGIFNMNNYLNHFFYITFKT